MRTEKPKIILSFAHEIAQALPLSDRRYVCMSCGHSGSLNEMFHGKRCKPHFVTTSSGWTDESTTPEGRAYLASLRAQTGLVQRPT